MNTTDRPRASLSATVLKALGIFGSVQMVGILCSVVRTKLVAMWLGATGVGLLGIFLTAMDTLGALAQMGLGTSSAREIAADTDKCRQRSLIVIIRRLGLILASAFAGVTVACAPLLSRWSFGTTEYTNSFRLLAVMVFVMPPMICEQGIMQGLKRYTPLARATMWGAVGGLAVTVPIYYFMGLDGIVPAIIASAIINSVLTLLISRRTTAPLLAGLVKHPSWRRTRHEGAVLLRLGFYVTMSMAAAHLASYAFLNWLNHYADTAIVGYFQAGHTLMMRYVGLIFTAMSMEYYPRLSTAATSRLRLSTFVGHEIVVIMALLSIGVPAFIAAAPLIVSMLYTPSFDVIIPMVTLGIMASVLRGFSTAVAFVILARGDGKVYIFTEVLSAILYVAISIGGYMLWGLTGLGAACIVWYLCYAVSVSCFYRLRYGLRLPIGAVKAVAFALCTSLAAMALVWFTPGLWVGNALAAVVTLGAAAYIIPKLKARTTKKAE